MFRSHRRASKSRSRRRARRAPSSPRMTTSAEPCTEHPDCIRFYRPDGAINEAGEWHAQWHNNTWHVRGPDPADAGFPTLGGPIDKWVRAESNQNPLAALLPFVGDEALMAAIDLVLPSDQDEDSAARYP
jgi:hypothetical protein